MKLYYLPGACSLADHIVLEWAGRPYEAKKVDRAEIKSPAYLEMNPAGAVPVLQDGDWTLTENVAILGYIADSNPSAKLIGDGTPRGRAEVMRWLGYLNSDVHKSFSPIFSPGRYSDDESQHDALKAKARARVREVLAPIDRRLEGRDWLAGARSIADPYLYVMLRWARANAVDVSGFANLARFFDRVNADAAVQKVLKDEGLS